MSTNVDNTRFPRLFSTPEAALALDKANRELNADLKRFAEANQRAYMDKLNASEPVAAPKVEHVMIDLETLGLTPNSVILSIGAVPFHLGEGWKASSRPLFRRNISIGSSLLAGMDVSRDTINWWKSQPADLRDTTFADGIDLTVALKDFSKWFKESGYKYVWGNGSDFDIALLKRAYDLCGLQVPWDYRDVRCYRTISAMFKTEGDYVKPVKAHDPISDAVAQVETLRNIKKRF